MNRQITSGIKLDWQRTKHGEVILNELKCEKILQVLKMNSTDGISLIRLSRRTRIRLVELHSFLRSHSKMFDSASCLSKYRISQRAPYNGDVELVRIALCEEREAARQEEAYAYGIIYFAVFMGFALTLFLVL